MRFLAGTNIGGNLRGNVRVRQGQHAEMALSCRNRYSVFFLTNTAFYHGGIGVFSAKMANIMGTNIRGNVRDNVRGNTLKWRFPLEINTAFFLGKYGVLSWRNRRFLGQNGKYKGDKHQRQCQGQRQGQRQSTSGATCGNGAFL